MAKECGISYFECSAKTGENIDPIFNDLIKKTIENYKVLEDATKLDSKKKSKKKRFC